MKEIKDKFSNQSGYYKKYRPNYPEGLYQDVLKFVINRNECLDCGTGNGQVAVELSKYFRKVCAIDISKKQIDNAEKRENIIYSVERAENTNFNDSQFDLITAGQAVHWFDLKEFNREVKRVSKNGGIISVWGYGLLRITESINKLIDEFYYDIVGPYWNKERKHIDNSYRSIKFDFEEINLIQNWSMIFNWNIKELEGYLNTWSSVQNYKIENGGENPVYEIVEMIRDYWKDNSKKEVRFDIFMRMGRIEK